jgi:murein tripeptide amidase MpaA
MTVQMTWTIFALSFLFFLHQQASTQSAKESKIFTFTIETKEQLKWIKDLAEHPKSGGFDFLQFTNEVGGIIKVMVVKTSQNKFIEELESRKIIFETKDPLEELRDNKMMHGDFYTNYRYLNYDEIFEWARHIAERYHPFIIFQFIGRTYEGRHLFILKISKSSDKPILFLDAGIHAREWIAPASAIYLVEKLIQDRSLLSRYQIYVMPVLNPDGYAYTHTKLANRYWRKNRSPQKYGCFGVDLNRNFANHWMEAGATMDPCQSTFAGSKPNSELETQAFIKYMNTISRQVKAYVSLHSYGQLVLFPYGYTTQVRPPNYSAMKKLGDRIRTELAKKHGVDYKVGAPGDLLYNAAGGTFDYMYEQMNISISYAIELSPTDTPDGRGFDLEAHKIPNVGENVYTIVKTILA